MGRAGIGGKGVQCVLIGRREEEGIDRKDRGDTKKNRTSFPSGDNMELVQKMRTPSSSGEGGDRR